MERFLILAILASVMVGPFLDPAPVNAQETIAITNVGVVDVEVASVRDDQTVVIRDGRIVSIETDGAVPSGASVIDGSGKFLMPGLWDLHVHIRNAAAPRVLLPQFVANGVTGVRDMGSDCAGSGDTCLPELLKWRAQIEAGRMLGPRILELSSFPVNPNFGQTAPEGGTRMVVARAHERGADLIKVYYRLSPEGLGFIVDEARRRGMYVGGHIPIRMTATEVSNAGLRTLEHARDFLFDCFPGSAEFRATTESQNPPMDVMRSMVDDHDVEQCEAVFETFVRNDTWYVPTHVTRRMDAYADDPAFRADERRRFLPDDVWDAWQQDADRMVALDPSPEGRRVMRGFYEKGLEITGRAHASGVNIVLGTDAGDTYVFPGSGAHDELGEFVKAGLTPAEALATATLNAARFVGLEDRFGSVAVGKHADLLLIDGSPLDDIANTRRISAVLLNGRVLDRLALDAMLGEVVDAIAEFGN
ncbi:MAG: amidohydrolase family protein [Gemmatimonadota bacterium]|nr:amidohydrolase family protein [Gemmatimonadota bacterium]